MEKIIELVFRGYKSKENKIQKGFIDSENIEWVTEHLMLKYLTNEELAQMWTAVDNYFTKIRLDDSGKNWRTDISAKEFSFYGDTWSAWLEVINMESRERKEKGLL